MTREGAPAVFVLHDVAAVHAAIQWARDAAMDSIMADVDAGRPEDGGEVEDLAVRFDGLLAESDQIILPA
jgi:hypothetical protein